MVRFFSKKTEARKAPSLFEGDDAHAISSWISQVEQIAMTATRRQTRMLGIVGAETGSGVSQLSELMATSFAKSQRRTLLLDLRASVDFSDTPPDSWTPGQPNTERFLVADPRGFERLRPVATPTTRPIFNNVELLRTCIETDLQAYDQIVVDLPGLMDTGADGVNPVGPAVACDAVLMVCMTGRTTRHQAKRAAERLQTAGANLAGTILNDAQNVSLGNDLASFARRFRWLSPSLSRRLERFGRTNTLVN